MFAVYAFAFALAAGGAAASSRFLSHAGARRRPGQSMRRDRISLAGPTFPIGTTSGGVSAEDYREAAGRVAAPSSGLIKRCLDILLSIGLICFLSPLLLLTAVAIRIDSRGPILYRQRRVGFGGREFSIFKFRSMRVGSEPNGPQYAAVNDARVTRVGRFIRKFRIDEIPQTINVLRGEMSFVGPRPERPEFVRELEMEIPNYHCRHLVKPGITGWAQVKYEYAATVEGARNKLRYDLYYIRHFSPALDLLIVLMTIRVALFGVGSR